jgi:hypothetical protein
MGCNRANFNFIILLIYYNKVYRYNITVNYVKYGRVVVQQYCEHYYNSPEDDPKGMKHVVPLKN